MSEIIMKNKPQETRNRPIINLTLSAMFLAVGIVLPFLTGQIKQIGTMLLPMHIPVLLCGFICGWQYGLIVGLILPIFRSMLFSMPVLFPTAVAMAFELATYGAVAGLIYFRSRWKCVIALYRSLIIAMLSGRVVWGIVQMLLLGIRGNRFTWQMFFAGAFLNAIPGIVLQLVFIPVVMVALNRAGLVRFTRHSAAKKRAENAGNM